MGIDREPSPRIEQVSWGTMRVEGFGRGKDFKLWPGGAREWNWAETGTHHVPGIQPGDVRELVDNGSRIIVLSRGMLLRLRTAPETLQLLKQLGVDVRIAETKEATRLYNELAAAGEAVGGLFHSTC
jgi:hypothetical protein